MTTKPLRGHIEKWAIVRWEREGCYVVIGQHAERGAVRTSAIQLWHWAAGIETRNSLYTLGTPALASETRALVRQCFPYLLQPEECA